MNVNYLEHHSAIVKTQSSQHAKTNVFLLVKELAQAMATKSAATTIQTIA
jgi:mannose/fructose/N-acetylgalactosamine-specific phosphotransferase system component IIB